MRAVLQRVTHAEVTVEGETVGAIDRPGLVALVGVTHEDGAEQVAAMVLFLCRDEAAQVTGANISIDGGWTAQ